MKNILLITGLIFILTACTGVKKVNYVTIEETDSLDRKALKTSLSEYTEATVANDVEKLVHFMYSKVFTIVSKETMVNNLVKAYATGKIPQVTNVKHLNISSVKKYNEGLYAVINSSMTTSLKSPKEDSAFESYMLEMLKNKIGSKGTVTFNKKSHQFHINHSNQTLALTENNQWKFIGFQQAKKYMKKNILPLELKKVIQ